MGPFETSTPFIVLVFYGDRWGICPSRKQFTSKLAYCPGALAKAKDGHLSDLLFPLLLSQKERERERKKKEREREKEKERERKKQRKGERIREKGREIQT